MHEKERHETKCLNVCDREENKRKRTKKKTKRGHVCEHMREMNTVGRMWKRKKEETNEGHQQPYWGSLG